MRVNARTNARPGASPAQRSPRMCSCPILWGFPTKRVGGVGGEVSAKPGCRAAGHDLVGVTDGCRRLCGEGAPPRPRLSQGCCCPGGRNEGLAGQPDTSENVLQLASTNYAECGELNTVFIAALTLGPQAKAAASGRMAGTCLFRAWGGLNTNGAGGGCAARASRGQGLGGGGPGGAWPHGDAEQGGPGLPGAGDFSLPKVLSSNSALHPAALGEAPDISLPCPGPPRCKDRTYRPALGKLGLNCDSPELLPRSPLYPQRPDSAWCGYTAGMGQTGPQRHVIQGRWESRPHGTLF